MSLLNDEESKAAAAVKSCKKTCGWTNRKHDLIEAARKKAKDSCSRNDVPDINDINKGLEGNAKEKLKNLYDRNSRMFDGTAKIPSKDFDVKSNQSPASTGKGGQVSDLKSSEPDIKKITSPSEFSLASKSTTLPASAKTASAATPKASAQAASYIFWCSCPQDDTGTLFETTDYSDCVKQCCEKYHGGTDCPSGDGDGTGSSLLDKLKAAWKKLQDSAKTIKDWLIDKYHELVKDEIRCGKTWYNPDKQCCVKGKKFNKCGGHCMPPSEFAVFKNNVCPSDFTGYCKAYNIYFRDSQYLDLAGVNASESLKNKRQVDSRPICYPGLPKPTDFPLKQGSNGLFGFSDTLGISAEVTITTPCAHQFDQEIMVGGCRIQTNILTFEADPSGARRIFRSDEPTIGPRQ
ncbi:MAG: hypothetical protein HY796_04515 [Elusimicrobia bacterium]|nr:hypothetical protein [Elusimicrobiota bacterium]